MHRYVITTNTFLENLQLFVKNKNISVSTIDSVSKVKNHAKHSLSIVIHVAL